MAALPVLTSNLTRVFRDGGVEGISFEVEPGERVALFGRPASGKSVLLSLLAGAAEPGLGEVLVFGRAATDAGSRVGAAIHRGSARESSTPRAQIQRALSAAHVPSVHRSARLAEALHVAGLHERADRSLRELNESARTSLEIACATAHHPDLVLLDDLTRRLAPEERRRWWRYLDDRRQVDGVAVVFATLDCAEAEQADRVLLLDTGRMVGLDSPTALLSRCDGEEITVDASEVEAIDRTLRGISQVRAVSTPEGTRFYAEDGASVAAHLFRHPVGGLRSVFIRRPTLWDCLNPRY